MPTNKKKERKVIINGEAVEPIEKTRLPREVDWQSIVKKKQNG